MSFEVPRWQRFSLSGLWFAAWLLGLGTMGCIFGSLLVQLYGPAPAVLPSPTKPGSASDATETQPANWRRAWCGASLASLQVELEEQFAQSAAHIQHAPTLQHFANWQVAWKNRFDGVLQRCQTPHDSLLSQATSALAQLDAAYTQAAQHITDDSHTFRHHIDALRHALQQ